MAQPNEDAPTDGSTDSTDGSTDSAPAAKGGRLERLLSPFSTKSVAGAPTEPAVLATNAKGVTTKWAIDRLDNRERLFGYGAAIAAAFFSVLIYVAEVQNKNFQPAKGQFSPTTTLIMGVSAAILLAVTTRIGRRALVGFVALFAFLGFSNADFVIGLPFLVLAGWLLYRSYKVQKEATNKVRADRAAGITPVDTTRPGRAPRPNPTTARGSRSKGPALPEGNKRYTPKKPTPPPPPAPKPSWSERRAAKSAGSNDSAS